MPTDVLDELKPIHIGHLQIGEHEVGWLGVDRGLCLTAIRGIGRL